MANLSEGVTTLVVGLAVVFAVLIIIMIVTSLFKFFAKSNANSAAKETATQQPAKAPVVTKTAPAEFKPGFDTEDGELIAVIAASISAALGTESGDIKIRSIRKVN